MRFRVSLFDRYPGAHIGVLAGRGLRNPAADPRVEEAKRDAVVTLRDRMGGSPLSSHPQIASWRDTYRSFGTKAGDYRPSAEALAKRVLKDGALPRINAAVDAYNAVSIRHLVPMGGFDLDRVRDDIRLRLSGGGEAFTPLGPAAQERTYPGEVVYADDERVLTRRWNHRDCEETKITEATVNVALFADGSPGIPLSVVEEAVRDLEALLGASCGGGYRRAVLAGRDDEFDLG